MTEFLTRLFVRDYHQTENPAVRARYGTMVSIVCICCNLLLSGGKFVTGLLLGSIAITADAVNNLSDAGSSLVTLVSFRISSKPPDRGHPFGHARMEYVASMVVAFLILLVGFDLLRSSVDKILHPAPPDDRYLIPSMLVLGVSVLVKLWMSHLNRSIGRRIDSAVMRATAADSLFDCLSTLAVLLSTALYACFGWDFLDGYFGLFVAILIFTAGIRILNDTKNSILGERPVEGLVDRIRAIVSEYPEALGVHDIIVHNYGPGHTIVSLHVEVNGAEDFFAMHDVIDNIEHRLGEELCLQCTIHADPIVVGDPEVDRLREEVADAAASVDPAIRIHDLRFVRGNTHCNLIFDMAVPYECRMSDEELRRAVTERIVRVHPQYRTVITVDRS